MSSAKFEKHLVDSFLGPTQNRHSKSQSENVRTSDYLYRYMNRFKPVMSIAEPKFGRGKRIKVWMNGEAHCYEFNINPKDFRSWTSILLHITNSVKPIFGAVRKLVALSSLKPIDSFEALDPNERYVGLGAACRLKMAPGGYRTYSEKELYNRDKAIKRFYSGEMNSKVLPFLLETEKKKLTVIYVAVNGRNSQTPQKLVLNSNDMRNWVLIYKYLTKVLDIPDGIACICTIFGDVLKEPSELQHGYIYVALPFKEHFVNMDYISLFEEHQSKYRSSYTLTIRPAPPPPEKLYSAIKKVKKRINSSEYHNKQTKLPSRPTSPLQKKRSSIMSIKQEPRLSKQPHHTIKKELPTRSELQPTGQVANITDHKLATSCDSEPGAQNTSIIQEQLADPMEAYEKSVADIEKKYSEDEEKIRSCSNVTDSGVHLKKNISVITSSHSESIDESPTYTLVKVPSTSFRTNSNLMSGCNLMTIVDNQLSIKDNVATTGSSDDILCIEEESFKGMNKSDLLEQHSPILIRNSRNQQKIQNGNIMSNQNAPTIHIRNRTDINIYNLKTDKTSTELKCKREEFEVKNKSNVSSARKSTRTRPQSNEEFNNKQNNNPYKGTRSRTTQSSYRNAWRGAMFIPPYGARNKAKSKMFTLKSITPDNNFHIFASIQKGEEPLSVENSDETDTDENTSQTSSDAKPFISERGDILDSERWNLYFEHDSESIESIQGDVDHRVKENILEIKDVRKSLQKRIGIGSFRVSTPEVENCLRYPLGDGKYIEEDKSQCSISSDSIESK